MLRRPVSLLLWKLAALVSRLSSNLPSYWQLKIVATAYRIFGRYYFLRQYRRHKRGSDARRFVGSRFAHRWPGTTFQVLLAIGCPALAADLTLQGRVSGNELGSSDLRMLLDGLFERAEITRLRNVLARVRSGRDEAWKYEVAIAILDGVDETFLTALIWQNAWPRPDERRPHQNLAARSGGSYIVNDVDAFAGPDGALFDLCNYVGQRLVHVGLGASAIATYAKAIRAQERLRGEFPAISNALRRHLTRWGVILEEMRIAPSEWTTQIGHLGFLDYLIRLRTLGWWTGPLLILADPVLVANAPCLALFEEFALVVVRGRDVSEAVWAELCSLQRWCGWNFNVAQLPDGEIVNWPDASAFAAVEWHRAGYGHPIRERYASTWAQDERVRLEFEKAKAGWGMADSDWFVCLHIREPTFYGESNDSGQAHRNAEFQAYEDAVRFVVEKGGWVIRLGSKFAPILPKIPRLVDYARSVHKSATLDLHLLYSCRFFIGTTSGLGNIANSFGVPMALVNCITIDGQLWHEKVRFVLKPVFTRDGEMMSQRELSGDQRWALFGAGSIQNAGLEIRDNSTDEILETVKEVYALTLASTEDTSTDKILPEWRQSLAVPYFYGMGQPSSYFVHKYREWLLDAEI